MDWLIRAIQRQPELSGKIQWGFQFVLRLAATLIFVILTIGVVVDFRIVESALQGSIRERSQDGVRNMVDAMAMAIEATVPPGESIGPELEDTAQKRIREIIRQARFSETGYFILFDLDGLVLSQGTDPEDVGKSHLDNKDADGHLYIQELITAAREKKGKFVQYKWPKRDGGKPYDKIAYPRLLKGDRWWIASGVYRDTLDQVFQENVDKQHKPILVLAAILFVLTAAFLFFVSKLGEVLGNKIAQPVLEQMKDLGKRADRQRYRLAGELHNLVGGWTFPLAAQLAEIARTEDAAMRRMLLKEASTSINHFDADCQNLERDIYPLVVRRHGVATALKYWVEAEREGREVPHVELAIDELVPQIDSEREYALYLVAQDLFRNTRQLAQASKIRITLAAQAQNVTLTVEDNGASAEPDIVTLLASKVQSHVRLDPWMLAHIEAYGGQIKVVDSSPGQRTTVQVTLPWQ